MRVARFVAMLACELGCFWFFIWTISFVAWAHWATNPAFGSLEPSGAFTDNVVFRYLSCTYPFWLALLSFIICIGLYILAIGCSFPFRYTTKKPGLDTKTCWQCGAEIADTFKCKKCKAVRVGKIATSAVWGLSLLLTTVFIIHDIVFIIFTVSITRK